MADEPAPTPTIEELLTVMAALHLSTNERLTEIEGALQQPRPAEKQERKMPRMHKRG